jgi:protein-disulfide isomerase
MNSGLVVTLLVGGLAVGGAVGYITGNSQGKKSAISSLQVTSSENGNEALFHFKGKTFTKQDLPSDAQSRLYSIEHDGFHQKEGFIKEFSMRLALADAKGLAKDLSKLPNLEALLEKPTPSDEELRKFFEENKARLPPNTAFEQIKPRLVQFLTNQKMAGVFQKKWEELESNNVIKLLAAKPVAPIVSLPIEKYPQLGNADAKHTLVEVSDYLCPHCQSMHPEVKKLVASLGDKIKLVQINLSLRPDQLSGSLAEGAYCAQEQGSETFWKYHNTAFEGKWGAMGEPANADKATEIAVKAGLDKDKFSACLASGKGKKFVEETSEVASSIGVNSTPTFFLDNRRISLEKGNSLNEAVLEQINKKASNG